MSRPVRGLLMTIALLFAASAAYSADAFASAPTGPAFTSRQVATGAQFVIPKNSDARWTLRLWSQGVLLGSVSGTSGTLSLPTSAAQPCQIQADVQTTRKSGRFRFYSGNRATSLCCPTSSAGGLTATVGLSR